MNKIREQQENVHKKCISLVFDEKEEPGVSSIGLRRREEMEKCKDGK